ncbi:glycosyltransferase involved in cell wall biosynthesis [Salinibacter ruber]|uniref:glycosyltransferase family 4 protein n=1 Tax=Salinibacter ruber TaxID=146919 RepID=UPI002167FB57|nr:glycosyltransferase family 4 protein [Salinibacter ruber]MCS3657976.1 glycosyltransferase involved in cell wall biosynthesis [Salinibacter ruber]MCS4169867.1 glycosyltransferase involved in cell wall biosynthesis [Salinibacter ruber]
MRLAVVSTHPIQYYAPLFRQLAKWKGLDLHVFFGWSGAAASSAHDPGFGQDVEWDIPLLEGYEYTFVTNVSSDPGTHHFRGLINPELVPSVEAWKPDAVLVYGWAYQSHLRTLWSLSGRVPVFFRGDSTLLDERGWARPLLRRLVLRTVYRYVDVALPVGTNNEAYFRVHGFDDDTLHWVPHSIENCRFEDDTGELEAEALEWRQELGIDDNAVVFLFAGKLGAKKAPDVLLDAHQQLDGGHHLVFAGSGPLEDELRERASRDDHVHFLGFQNQSRMPTVYRLGDVFVLPSRGPGETWGLAVNEAMACGRPVIVSDRVGCAPDLVDDGRNGYVCEAGSTDSLAQMLQACLGVAERLEEMGQTSRTMIEDWSIPVEARRIVGALDEYL